MFVVVLIFSFFIDHDRPLSKAGQVDAARVSHKLQQLGWIPELILCRLGFLHLQQCFSNIHIKSIFGVQFSSFNETIYMIRNAYLMNWCQQCIANEGDT